MEPVKYEATHTEAVQPEKVVNNMMDLMMTDSERAPEARGRDLSALPKGYFYSATFIGAYCAIGFSFMAATGGYALIAPLLGDINEDIGPSPNITWVALCYLLMQAVAFLIVGRLSDVFGRRWFFITGSIIGLIGSILGATAQTVNQMIGAQVFIGLAAGFQIFLLLGCWGARAHEVEIPCQLGIHPPTFKMLHRRSKAKDLLLHFDWIGLVLYSGSVLIFLMGLVWGGGLYPWKSGPVIGTIVGGAAGFIIFIFWEIYLPFENTEHFLPLHLFRNVPLSSLYIWPSAVSVLYTDLSDSRRGTLFGLVVMGFVFGQITGGFLATVTGPKPGIIFCISVAAPLLMAVAANPLNLTLTMGLITTGSLFIGMVEGIAICTMSFPLRTQEEIGTAGGLSGAIRSFGSCLAVAIYATTLTNRLKTTIPANVVPAATSAGLPASSIPALLTGLAGTTGLNSTVVPGLNNSILAVASQAYRVANAEAYKTVFLASFAFGGTGMIVCWFVAQNDRSKENFVAGHIHSAADEKALEVEEG